MSAANRNTVSDIRDWEQELKQFSADIENKSNSIMAEEAVMMESRAKNRCPVYVGKKKRVIPRKLYNSIRCDFKSYKNGSTIRARASAVAHDGYNYAEIQETDESFKHIVGQVHFLSSAYEEGVARIKRRFESELRRKPNE